MTTDIEILPGEGFIEARFLGAYSLEGYKRQMSAVGQACLDQHLKLMLVDIRDLRDFFQSTMARYELGRYGAKSGQAGARVAMLLTPEQLRDVFGATVARNLGLAIEVFTDRDKAVHWLLGSRGDRQSPEQAPK